MSDFAVIKAIDKQTAAIKDQTRALDALNRNFVEYVRQQQAQVVVHVNALTQTPTDTVGIYMATKKALRDSLKPPEPPVQ